MSFNPRNFSPDSRGSRLRTAGTWAVTSFSTILAALFVAVLLGQPGLVPAWIGLGCFSLAAVGGAITIVLDRRQRSNN